MGQIPQLKASSSILFSDIRQRPHFHSKQVKMVIPGQVNPHTQSPPDSPPLEEVDKEKILVLTT